MKIVELLIDELDKLSGFDAVALVEQPAIEADFMAFKEVDIEDLIAFEIIKQEMQEKFVTRLPGESKESYMERCIPKLKSEGYDQDQSIAICLDTFKITEEDFESIIDDGKPLFDTVEEAERVAKELGCEGHHVHTIDGQDWYMPCKEHSDLTDELLENYQFETYTDYPKQATENAKIALRWADENGWGSCGTPVGKARANQLAKGEPISEETIARMAAFARHRENGQKELGDGCGRLMWLAWGGDAGVDWAQRKLRQIREELTSVEKQGETFAFTGTDTKHNFALNVDEQVVVGPLMIPDKLIMRLDENNDPYYVFFSKETVRAIANKMMRSKLLDKMNIEHNSDDPVKGFMMESWIIEDSMRDKSQTYGFDLPVGTWMGMYKVENEDVWEMVKQQKLKGFSIEGFFSDKLIQAKKDNI